MSRRPKIKITITSPGQEKGKAEFCCSDADTIMVFEAEIVEQ